MGKKGEYPAQQIARKKILHDQKSPTPPPSPSPGDRIQQQQVYSVLPFCTL